MATCYRGTAILCYRLLAIGYSSGACLGTQLDTSVQSQASGPDRYARSRSRRTAIATLILSGRSNRSTRTVQQRCGSDCNKSFRFLYRLCNQGSLDPVQAVARQTESNWRGGTDKK